jgi:hypothetical protein
MPGLIRGVARTAVIAGTATAVSNNVSRRQANKWSQQEAQQQPQQQAYAPPPAPAAPAPAAGGDMMEQLAKLGQLRDAGILTEVEFEVQKAKILAGG